MCCFTLWHLGGLASVEHKAYAGDLGRVAAVLLSAACGISRVSVQVGNFKKQTVTLCDIHAKQHWQTYALHSIFVVQA